jgi:hypothetical protein
VDLSKFVIILLIIDMWRVVLMEDVSEIVLRAFRSFREVFCKSRHEWRVEKDICYDALRGLDETLDGFGKREKIEALDKLAAQMNDFIDQRIRYLMREEFDAIRKQARPPFKKVEAFKKHITFYDECYHQSVSEIEKFAEEHPLHPIGEETLYHCRSGFAHFGTLAMTYLDMLMPEEEYGSLLPHREKRIFEMGSGVIG